jgi:hypothetical protein
MGYDHSKEHSDGKYGSSHKVKVHGMGNHRSEFEGGHDFPKGGDKE